MSQKLRWGIMGTGNIARQFCAGMATSRRGILTAVGSRSSNAAEAFSKQYRVGSAHGSYDALLSDRDVDAVYISLPNSMHHEWTLKALRAGKHVLCEKPIAVNASQAQEMYDAASRAGLVLVEAFMYRSHPQTRSIRDTIAAGTIGEVKVIKTSFCYRTTRLNGNIRFDASLAGGAVMDIGCYCVSFSRLIAGEMPDRILAAGKLHKSGVDEWAGGTLHYPSGIVATFVCGMTVQADNSAYVCGSEGYLDIPWPWKPQRKASYTVAHSTPPRQDTANASAPQRPARQEVTVEAPAELYALEADDLAATIQDGAPPMLAAAESIQNMATLDAIRRQIGLAF
jgi:predicted dehydrogenase